MPRSTSVKSPISADSIGEYLGSPQATFEWWGNCVLLRQERRVSRKDAKIGAKAATQLYKKENRRMQ